MMYALLCTLFFYLFPSITALEYREFVHRTMAKPVRFARQDTLAVIIRKSEFRRNAVQSLRRQAAAA